MLKPTTSQLNVLATSLARKYAQATHEQDDLVQEGLWAYTKAVRRTRHPNKPFAFARTVMQRAMISYYHTVSQRIPDTEQLYPNTAVIYTTHTTIDERLWLEQYLEALESQHGSRIRTVAANLVDPTDKRVRSYILKEVRAKQRAQRRGVAVRGIHQIRLSQRQVREALGYTTTEWRVVMNILQTFTTQWLHLVGEDERLSRQTLTTVYAHT